MSPRELVAAFRAACAEELSALKPGNVHVFAGGHRMTVDDFIRSADAAGPGLCREGAKLGERVLDAIRATRDAVGQNTNLGIVLLTAPLVMAAERSSGGDLRSGVRAVLETADIADTGAIFTAIREAAPGGLGDAAQYDVRGVADVAPLVAMAAAADRDTIARQWVSGFCDVFGGGTTAYRAARETWPDPAWAPLGAYLWFLATFPDSHIARKHGAAAAERVSREAATVMGCIAAAGDPASLLPRLLEWDRALKAQAINPGTSADLTVATILAYRLGAPGTKNPIDSPAFGAG